VIASASFTTVPTAVAGSLRIGGFERFSTVDWPGQIAAVVFCQGCGWQCGYCHNPHLMSLGPPQHPVAWSEIVRWLEHRRELLDGVVFSGGEPTLQVGLPAAAATVRALGFKVALHTGGPLPANLVRLLPLLDWVGFDFKAPFDRYAQVTGHDHGARARESLQCLIASGVEFEVRTTWHPQLLSPADLAEMAGTLIGGGCSAWVIQRFRSEGCVSKALGEESIGYVPLAGLDGPALRITVR